jgi:large subunit ribosomal protein L10e
MARLRPASAYRKLKRPFTRKSKYKKHNYVGGVPASKIQIFEMGNRSAEFKHIVALSSKDTLNIRHNALESARIVVNKYMSKNVGKSFYHFKIKIYPHHVMREHALATGAGADRFSTGMQKAYGKSSGMAARVKKGQELMYIRINDANLKKAVEALKKAGKKLPCKTVLDIREAA